MMEKKGIKERTEEMAKAICEVYIIESKTLYDRTNTDPHREARMLLMLLLVREGYPPRHIAAIFGRDSTTVLTACDRIKALVEVDRHVNARAANVLDKLTKETGPLNIHTRN